jgi:hypothetical protein
MARKLRFVASCKGIHINDQIFGASVDAPPMQVIKFRTKVAVAASALGIHRAS